MNREKCPSSGKKVKWVTVDTMQRARCPGCGQRVKVSFYGELNDHYRTVTDAGS